MEDVLAINRGVDKTHVFLADSARRDAATYPSPSEYAVSFNAPFRDVVGFELLEVNVPRTDYIVDSTENTLTYSLDLPRGVGTWAADVAGNVRTATFEPGDYNLPQLINHMNDVLANVAVAHGDAASLVVAPVTSPPEVSNKVRIESSAPFCLLGDASGIRKTLGFGDPVTPAKAGTGAYDVVPGWSRDYPNGASGVFVARPGPLGESFPALVGPVPGGLGDVEPVCGAKVLREHFTAAAPGTPARASAYLATVGGAPQAVNVRVGRASDDATLAAGVMTSRDAGDEDLEPAACDLSGAGQLVAGQEYYLEFAAADPTTTPSRCAALWFAASNAPSTGTYATVDGAAFRPGSDFCADLTAGARGWAVTSPGIVSLVGAKYLKIRCLELEQHLERDRAGEPSSVGVGMVSLVGYGYQNQRYNFVHFPPIRFPPLGRVQKLTFRLERPDGTLYDAQGVDNNLLCAITYKVPKGDDAAREFPAAPGYVPDPAELQRRRWRAEAEATSRARRTGTRAGSSRGCESVQGAQGVGDPAVVSALLGRRPSFAGRGVGGGE